MTETDWAFVALGSNLGDRVGYLQLGRDLLKRLPRTVLVRATGVEETPALGPVPQDPYLNQMLLLETTLSPHALLEHCQSIEEQAGRIRDKRWGPRTLDVDIVRYGDEKIETDDLTLPHPEIPNRDFWLRELAELEPYARRKQARSDY